MKKKMSIFLISSLISILFLASSTTASLAQEKITPTKPVLPVENNSAASISGSLKKSGIEINPAVLEAEISASEAEKTIKIELINHNPRPITLELFALNFRQGDLDGLVQFLGEDSGSYMYSLASFIHLPYNEVQLDPQERQAIEVIVQNRQDLSPGGHYAGVIAREKPIKKISDKTNILPAVSSLILLKKTGGEQYNLSIREVNWPKNIIEFFYPKNVQITFQNEGNVHLVPYGRIEVRDMFNRLVSKTIINPSSLYVFPSSRRNISIDMKPSSMSLPISFNTFTIRGQDSLKKTNFAYQETYVYVNPLLIAVLILTPIILRLVSRKLKKNHRHD